jgi:hypothetical protein
MEQKIITAHSASDLNSKLADLMKEGWKPIGPHHVVEVHHQMRFSGMQHKDTIVEREYSLSIQREHTPSEGQKEVISGYLKDLTKILETKTDDLADLQNLRTATIEFLSVLKEKEDKIKS